MLCFYATKGMNPFNLAGKKKIKKSQPKIAESTIPFDDGIAFEKNFYEMLWHYWSINVERNLNLVLLYLQLKEGVIPTNESALNKSLLESEYDLLGYTSLRLHDDEGKIPYGRYKLPLYDGPIYIEDLRD